MTSEILAALVRANLAASAAVLVVLALRTPVARALSARAAYALWTAVPLAGAACLIPARVVTLHLAGATAVTGAAVPPAAPGVVAASFSHAANAGPSLAVIVTAVWALGAIAWGACLAWQQYRFHRALGPLRREAGVFRAQAAGLGPVLLGALRPRIVLPADFEARFTPDERVVVLAHEQAHLRAGDHLVNVAVAAFQCLCWFNPLAHIAATNLRVDQELACDAAVVARHPLARRVYAEAMLKTQVMGFGAPLACQWPAVGAGPLKRRIAMLKAAVPSASRRLAGLALAAAFSLTAGVAAWAAQPARVQIAAAQPASAPVAAPAQRRIAPAAEVREQASPVTSGRADQLGADLVEAIARGRQEKALALIDAGADVNHYTPGDGTPLVKAARDPDMVIARRLVAQGADVNRAAPGDGNPLIAASARGHKAFAALLLEHGANINAFVPGDETPLIAAARSQNPGMVRWLVERGADVNLTVPTGNWPGETRSPLSVTRDPRIADYLRAHGARG